MTAINAAVSVQSISGGVTAIIPIIPINPVICMENICGVTQMPTSAPLGRPSFHVPGPRREPDPKTVGTFTQRMKALADFANTHHLRFKFFTFTSAATGSDEQVMEHIKNRWAAFQQSAVWRRVLGAVWTFADHEKPHIHMAIVMPDDMTIRDFRSQWDGGITPHPKDVFDADGLGRYFARQRRVTFGKPAVRRRFHGFMAPKAEHFTQGGPGGVPPAPSAPATTASAPPASTPPPAPTPIPAARSWPFSSTSGTGAERDGHFAAGGGVPAMPSWCVSASSRPKAVQSGAAPTKDVKGPTSERDCESEWLPGHAHGSAASTTNLQRHLMPTNIPPPPAPVPAPLPAPVPYLPAPVPSPASGPGSALSEAPAYSFTAPDLALAETALLMVAARSRSSADLLSGLQVKANLNWKLAELAAMRLLFSGSLKRTGKGTKTLPFLYWASPGTEVTTPVIVPQRLRHFVTPSPFPPAATSQKP